MRKQPNSSLRRRLGVFLPFVAIMIVPILCCVALAIDLGVHALAIEQCQAAADSAALSGVRQLNGVDSDFGQSKVVPAATSAVNLMSVLAKPLSENSTITTEVGSYTYDSSQDGFVLGDFQPNSGEPPTMVTSTVSTTVPRFFSKIMGFTEGDIVTTATAVHRPRDIAIVIDFSGSMTFGTMLGGNHSGDRRHTSYAGAPSPLVNSSGCLNPDPRIPMYGHYSANGDGNSASTANQAGMVWDRTPEVSSTSGNDWSFEMCNYTVNPHDLDPSWPDKQVFADQVFQDSRGGPASPRAFAPAPDDYMFDSTTVEQGDSYPRENYNDPNAPYARRVRDIFNGTTTLTGGELGTLNFEVYGYDWLYWRDPRRAPGGTFQLDASKGIFQPGGTWAFRGYMYGPAYYGKTFWIWPPDPRRGDASEVTGERFRTLLRVLLGYGNSSAQINGFNTLVGTNGHPIRTLVNNWPWNSGGNNLAALISHLNLNFNNANVWRTNPAGPSGTSYQPTAIAPVYPMFPATDATVFASNLHKILELRDRAINPAQHLFDWRVKFCGTNQNRYLYNTGSTTSQTNTTARMRTRNSGSVPYNFDYQTIMTWLREDEGTHPNWPFPTQIRTGRIIYYQSIPTVAAMASPYSGNNTRFWGWFFDYVLGFNAQGNTDRHGYFGYGLDFPWGTANIANAAPPSDTDGRYMDYSDTPQRPRLRFWFGPMMMMDMMSTYNGTGQGYGYLCAGTLPQYPLLSCKIGMQAALRDAELNHPNDLMTTCYFNTVASARNRQARVSLGRDYDRCREALWFPTDTLGNPNAAIWYNDSTFIRQVPQATGGTNYENGLVLAHNQLTASTNSAVTGLTVPGGNGRIGAQKICIFMTDGNVNSRASGVTAQATTNKFRSYYSGQASMGSSGVSTGDTNFLTYIDRMAATSGFGSGGSLGDVSKPCLVHAIAFGAIFEPTHPAPAIGTFALNVLAQLEDRGNVTKKEASAPYIDTFKICIGTSDERAEKLRIAISRILQEDNVQIALIR